jgi:uncharacterized protein YndB with AHSA1/START domain
MSKLQVSTEVPNQIVMVREFAAPRALVMKAMTTPELIQRWLGGTRATVVSVAVDLRVGGSYRYLLRGPDGGELAFGGVYRELGDDRIVQTEKFDGFPSESTVTSTFTEAGGTTTLRVVVEYESSTIRDLVIENSMTDGAGESYDQLEALLAQR